jgi:hypothetical protein
MKTLLAFVIPLLLFESVQSKETTSLKRFSEMLMTTPCYTGLESPARDSLNAIKFIKKLSKDTKTTIKRSVGSVKPNTADYFITFNEKDISWNLWISVGKNGIRHITETWQSENTILLKKHLYESLDIILDSWGELSDEDDSETWFKWDRTDFGCGELTLIYVEEKRTKFVSRRLQFND